MPATTSLTSKGSTVGLRNVSSSKKKSSSGAPAGFTFVDQSADLRSIADKKIVDSDQRHLIRSHVMQKVRKDERMLGKKRPTGRDSTRRASSAVLTPGPNSTVSLLNNSPLASSTDRSTSSSTSPRESASPSNSSPPRQIVKVHQAPSQGVLDPFNTLPGGQASAKTVHTLLQYCFHKFIPITYPIEANSPREYNIWRLKVLQSQSANSATFFGLMSIAAAHQAITNGRHKDLRPTGLEPRPDNLLIDNDFPLMKSYALQATQERIAQNGWDGPTVEAIFSLIGAEQILGNFEEARFHLAALRKFFVDGNALDPASPASDWIPLIDVKGAMGTMSRPLFRLPWNPDPMPKETIAKLYHYHDPRLSSLGTGFGSVDGLGAQLQSILQQAVVLCRFCQFNAVHSNELGAGEYEMFRRKSLELEYDILSYIYPGSPTDENQIPNAINNVEQIARLAVLGMSSSIITKILPSLGIGRALTHYQNLASRDFFTTLRSGPSAATARFMVWASMVFAQCAHKQPEERFFVNSVAWYSRWAGISDWSSLELACSTFLYVPASHERHWQGTWSKVNLQSQSGYAHQHMLPSRSQANQTILRSQNYADYS